jgi:hypothetical protein
VSHVLQCRGTRILTATAAVVVAVMLALGAVSDVSARNPNPGILPPNSHAFGQTYGEWAADWWTWVITQGGGPLYDETGEECAAGQSGKVWFLAGSWVGPVERNCVVPPGKALFFPIQNNAFVGYEDDPWPFYPHADEAAARADLAAGNDASGGRSATIDGVGVEDLDHYRVTSPVFGAAWPEWQTFYPCVDDGWYLLLAPLSAGEHTISFTGWDGDQDITYYVTVGDEE